MILPLERRLEFTEEDLVQGFISGDNLKTETLFEYYRTKLTNFLRRKGFPGNIDPEDLVQDTFMRAIKSRGTLKNPDYFSTWLYKIALNLRKDGYKRLGTIRRTLAHINFTDIDEENDPAKIAELKDRAEYLDTRINRISSYRGGQCLKLHYLEGRPYSETASSLGMPSVSLKNTMHRARCSLRGLINPDSVY